MTEVATIDEQTPEATTPAIISVIERAASDPNVDVDKMERLLQMQERIMSVQAKAEHAAAKTAAMSEMPAIPKRGRVIFFIRWTWMSMKPSASHAIGLGFLALACLALLSILAVEYG
jgi:hypothetical protein